MSALRLYFCSAGLYLVGAWMVSYGHKEATARRGLLLALLSIGGMMASLFLAGCASTTLDDIASGKRTAPKALPCDVRVYDPVTHVTSCTSYRDLSRDLGVSP